MSEIFTTGEYAIIDDYIAAHAPGARLLPEITATLDSDYHTVWLDGQTVWHAYAYPGEDTWHLDRESAAEALKWLQEQLVLVFDRLADPDLYAEDPCGPRLVEQDEAVMEEYHDVELAAWGAGDPVATDRLIVRRIAAARAEVARLASLRAHHLRQAWQGDGSRGWQTRAAQDLGTSPTMVGKVLAADERRVGERRAKAAERR